MRSLAEGLSGYIPVPHLRVSVRGLDPGVACGGLLTAGEVKASQA